MARLSIPSRALSGPAEMARQLVEGTPRFGESSSISFLSRASTLPGLLPATDFRAQNARPPRDSTDWRGTLPDKARTRKNKSHIFFPQSPRITGLRFASQFSDATRILLASALPTVGLQTTVT